jgi:hypothetical protein
MPSLPIKRLRCPRPLEAEGLTEYSPGQRSPQGATTAWVDVRKRDGALKGRPIENEPLLHGSPLKGFRFFRRLTQAASRLRRSLSWAIFGEAFGLQSLLGAREFNRARSKVSSLRLPSFVFGLGTAGRLHRHSSSNTRCSVISQLRERLPRESSSLMRAGTPRVPAGVRRSVVPSPGRRVRAR